MPNEVDTIRIGTYYQDAGWAARAASSGTQPAKEGAT